MHYEHGVQTRHPKFKECAIDACDNIKWSVCIYVSIWLIHFIQLHIERDAALTTLV